ncbi:MAG: geranylgeranylglyceryl/heptaprenylglyceryl phosphate synthase [Bacteroidetes bacterium]|nr:geranylgeranylglyceryl/heptaprenylglyceryl phosphate synthase [Bacteroidota bacterium]
MKRDTYNHLVQVASERGAAFVVLLDPDKETIGALPQKIERFQKAGVDAFFVGGSLVRSPDIEDVFKTIKMSSELPVIGFPGSLDQISRHLDAVLYLSVVSGRNADMLFGRHVYVASIIKALGIEPIPTAYMLVESGLLTTAQYLNNSLPLPRSKPDIAAATALAAEMMGMKLLYLEGGSGAKEPVPVAMIEAVAHACESPIAVGGGLSTPELVRERVKAGASIIVVGNALEANGSESFIAEMVAAAHVR